MNITLSFENAIVIAHILVRMRGEFTASELAALEEFVDRLEAAEARQKIFPSPAIVNGLGEVVAFPGRRA